MKNYTFLLVSFLLTVHLFGQPVIHSFQPTSGPIGTSVTIIGTGFSTTAADNIVYFGAVKTRVSQATDSTLSVIVPVGATYQSITVTSNSLTAYSTNPFNVTFPGGGGSPFTVNSFAPKMNLTTGFYPHSLSVADFNGDGKSDLLVCKRSSNIVSIFSNTSSPGSISFAQSVDLTTAGNNHEGSATGDLDGDGKLDFAIVTPSTSNSVSVYRNTSVGGSISFAPKLDYAADNTPYSIAIGDVNGDGKPDLVVANNGLGSDKVSIYKNTSAPGTVSFDVRVDFPVGRNPYSVAIGDLDEDGKPDVAITTEGIGSALSVMKNTSTAGTILFQAPVVYATLFSPYIVSIGDLDGDGRPDLAAASSASNSVVVLCNTSTPGNLSFNTPQHFAVGNNPFCVSISDLDGDGKPDIVTSNRASHDISALKNMSTIGSISFAWHVDYALYQAPLYMAIGDLDGDGKPDLAASNGNDMTVSIFRNIIGLVNPSIVSFSPTSGQRGTTVKITGSNFTSATSVRFGGVEASSFIVDSATGITAVVGTGESGDVSVTTGKGTSTLGGFNFYGPIITSFTPTIGVTGTIITVTGSNFTGVTDVSFGGTSAASFTVNSTTTITAIVGTGSGGSVTVTTATGTATLSGFMFGVPTITSFTPSSAPVGHFVTITGTNFNPMPSDNIVFFGAVKATVSSGTSTQLNVIVPAGATYQPITVTTNNLTTYSAKPFILTFPNDIVLLSVNSFSGAVNYGTGAYPSDVCISDLNDDGKPDLVIANRNGNTLSILKNSSTQSNLSFNVKTDYSTDRGPMAISLGDLDGDGKPDIVIAYTTSTISVFRNTSAGGTISFAGKVDYSTFGASSSVVIRDMNGDGKPDVVVASDYGRFSIFGNTTTSTGSISFSTRKDYILNSRPSIAIADLDSDGLPEIITANSGDATISIFRNTSTRGMLSFAEKVDYGAGVYPGSVTAGDLDGDGKIDLAVLTSTSGTISFYKNYSDSGNIAFQSVADYALEVTNVSIADLNGDGMPDLSVGRGAAGIVSIIQNMHPPSGNFSFGPHIDFPSGTYGTYVSIGDLNGDSKPDLAVVNYLSNTVSILKNTIAEPVITGLSTNVGGDQTPVTLYGSNFKEATSVKFGGIPAVSFTVISSTEIDAIVGAGASGDVTVTTPLGTGTFAAFGFIPEISPGGPTSFCKDRSVILTSSASANNQWYKDGTAISGATANTLTVNTSGKYTIKLTSHGITTSSDSDQVVVTEIMLPTPIISRDANNNLESNSTTGNQWYLNGDSIPGATNQTYSTAQRGSYSLRYTVNGCISDLSDPYNFTVSGIIDLGNGEYINLYPNPVKNKMSITWDISGMPLLNVEVTDLQGKRKLLIERIQSGSTIDVSQLLKGIYLVRIFNTELKINNTIKIMKEN